MSGARSTAGKVMSRPQALRFRERARRRGERVVFTNGCFDLLHAGHVASLEEARGHGEHLIVGLNSDASVRAQKGDDRPVVPGRERARVLAGLACVDAVVFFRAATPLRLICALRPDVLAKGGDWALDQIAGRKEVESWGGRVVRLREVPGIRSSAIIDRIRGG